MDAKEASESVAERFTRVMNATPSPLGVGSDVTAASAISGLLVALGLFAIRSSADASALYLTLAVALLPLGASLLVSVGLRGTRKAVVGWLAAQPIPIENLNAMLAGLGDTIEVVFAPGAEFPTRDALQPKLDQISDDVFVVSERPDEHSLEIRLGIVDSKRIPLRTNHLRWKRFLQVLDGVLLPLSKGAPIERVWVV